jgi:hypothetical protein
MGWRDPEINSKTRGFFAQQMNDDKGLLRNLKFDFESVMKGKRYWGEKRITFHRNFETKMQQLEVFLHYFQKVVNRPLKLGILLPDIYPESSETFATLLSCRLASTETSVSWLTRKKPTMTEIEDSTKLKQFVDWNDPKAFSKFDVIAVICSNVNFPIVLEIASNQIDYERTIFYCTSTALSIPRLQFLLKSDLVLIPLVDFDAKPTDQSVLQTVHLTSNDFEPHVSLMDLDLMKRVVTTAIVTAGSPVEVAQE